MPDIPTPDNATPTIAALGDDALSIELPEMLGVLSAIQDMINPALDSHQQRVCLISVQMGRHLGISAEDYRDLFAAALIHDIGAIPLQERLSLLEFEDSAAQWHAELGAVLIKQFAPLAHLAPIIRHHHDAWNNESDGATQTAAIPFLSQLIHVADRAEVLIQRSENILADRAGIQEKISRHAGSMFNPAIVSAFMAISARDRFWLDLKSRRLDLLLHAQAPIGPVLLGLDRMVELARFFALVIDCRSHFTATHSAGVATTAFELAQLFGMDANGQKKILVAGYLHDIGKLAISPALLEKSTALDPAEFALMRSHAYLGQEALSHVAGLAEIARWGSSHHERLDGTGYPDQLGAADLSLPARIIQIADVFTALREDRPYRAAMDLAETITVIAKQVALGKLDPWVFDTLDRNAQAIDSARHAAQLREDQELNEFWSLAVRNSGRPASNSP
jgi:HD-GYP domain-containing protein (c-di-GMP phosphodiesterase class II)